MNIYCATPYMQFECMQLFNSILYIYACCLCMKEIDLATGNCNNCNQFTEIINLFLYRSNVRVSAYL